MQIFPLLLPTSLNKQLTLRRESAHFTTAHRSASAGGVFILYFSFKTRAHRFHLESAVTRKRHYWFASYNLDTESHHPLGEIEEGVQQQPSYAAPLVPGVRDGSFGWELVANDEGKGVQLI